ncbi:MAG: AAA family ATPase, partial [Deltaproteobacteria bacterium]|nr:AAA family ATPase [Deltaproteobacteria bacterium]
MKKLPIGDHTFAAIIDKGYLYADKTQYIYELLRSGSNAFFLSRPRRFGKTLLLHTFNELFSGNRERFKDLWIVRSDYVFQKHPVLFLSLSMKSNIPGLLEANLLSGLKNIARKANLTIDGVSSDTVFGNLIEALYEQAGSKPDSGIVVLIDEYDAPVTRNMLNIKVAEDNANTLHEFFAALKKPEVSPCLHFTFVTGITRY